MCLIFFILVPQPKAEDFYFHTPSNYGSTGLLEIPTARLLNENNFRFGISQAHPYRWYFATFTPYDGIEINARVTEILGVPGFPGEIGSKYGNYKDKAVDFKFRIVKEDKYLPQIAIGINDPHGTRLYSAQYIVLSKQIYPFDITIGMGNGRFGKRPLPSSSDSIKFEMLSNPKQWLKDSKVFFGMNWNVKDNLNLFWEYNPIDYRAQINDPALRKYFKSPIKSRLNIGAEYKPYSWLGIRVSYQRGDQIGAAVYVTHDLSKPIIPYIPVIFRETPQYKLKPLEERVLHALDSLGFRNVILLDEENSLAIYAENRLFLDYKDAVKHLLKALGEILPDKYEKVEVHIIKNNVPAFSFYTYTDVLKAYAEEKVDFSNVLLASKFDNKNFKIPDGQVYLPKKLDLTLKPNVRTFLNDPSGFFKYAVGAGLYLRYNVLDGVYFNLGAETYPINNISSVIEPLSIPVRSDITKYLKEKAILSNLYFTKYDRFGDDVFTKISAGWLELMYAGIDGEIGKPFFNNRILASLEGSWVLKRKPGFTIENYNKEKYDTYFLNLRYNFKEIDSRVDFKIGKFLAGDKGVRVELTKEIKGGIELSFWYSFTNTSVFSDQFNRGYHDKGVMITIPFKWLTGKESQVVYSYGIAPWTRDVAQYPYVESLIDFIQSILK